MVSGVACVLLLICLLLGYWIGTWVRHQSSRSRQTHGPKIVHLMYLPWDRSQKLKDDPLDFDHSYERDMRSQLEPQGWSVRMWTGPELKREFPSLWDEAMKEAVRPTQLVDLFRWAVVAKYGGVYIQYDSVVHVPVKQLLPHVNKSVRLFTERVLTNEECRKNGLLHPIRNGEPEEPTRVQNQCFSSSVIGHPFIVRVRDTILENMRSMKPVQDYDVLYIGANARVSTLYDRHGRLDPTVELEGESGSKRMLTVSSRGSWRLGR